MFTVRTPEKGFSGEVAGVMFTGGVAKDVVKGSALAYFRSQGYIVEDSDAPEATTAEAAPEAPEGDSKLPKRSASAADWREYATANGMTAEEASTLSRDQLAERFTTTKEQP